MFNPEDLAYDPSQEKKRRFKLPKLPSFPKLTISPKQLIGGIAAVAFIGGGTYGYFTYLKPQASDVAGASEEARAPKEVMGIIDKVKSKSPYVPEAEIPSVATVTDLSKLQDQTFFEGAQQGDKVLIYAISKKAYLYRPDSDQLLREAPVEIENDPYNPKPASESAQTSSDPVLRIKF